MDVFIDADAVVVEDGFHTLHVRANFIREGIIIGVLLRAKFDEKVLEL